MKESLEETASLYVLDQLEPRDRALVEARLAHEPALAALVHDYESALAAGVRSLPPRAPSPLVLERIEEQIDALEAGKIETFRRSPSPPAFREARMRDGHNRGQQADEGAASRLSWKTVAQWGIAAVVTVSLATLAVQSLRRPSASPVFVVVGLDANRNTFAELPSPGPVAKDADTRFIQLASAAEDLWRNPAARPLPVAPATTGNHGYALYDPSSQQGFIAIEQLPALADNQRYHLWVIDDSTRRIRDAGILPLAGVSRGLYSFALEPGDTPKADRTRPNFFITVEDATAPSPATPQPRGKVVLGKDRI